MKNRSVVSRLGRGFLLVAAVLALSSGTGRVLAQEKQVGDVAEDFQLVNVMTNEPVNLRDFENSIIFLDFFFYW